MNTIQHLPSKKDLINGSKILFGLTLMIAFAVLIGVAPLYAMLLLGAALLFEMFHKFFKWLTAEKELRTSAVAYDDVRLKKVEPQSDDPEYLHWYGYWKHLGKRV